MKKLLAPATSMALVVVLGACAFIATDEQTVEWEQVPTTTSPQTTATTLIPSLPETGLPVWDTSTALTVFDAKIGDHSKWSGLSSVNPQWDNRFAMDDDSILNYARDLFDWYAGPETPKLSDMTAIAAEAVQEYGWEYIDILAVLSRYSEHASIYERLMLEQAVGQLPGYLEHLSFLSRRYGDEGGLLEAERWYWAEQHYLATCYARGGNPSPNYDAMPLCREASEFALEVFGNRFERVASLAADMARENDWDFDTTLAVVSRLGKVLVNDNWEIDRVLLELPGYLYQHASFLSYNPHVGGLIDSERQWWAILAQMERFNCPDIHFNILSANEPCVVLAVVKELRGCYAVDEIQKALCTSRYGYEYRY